MLLAGLFVAAYFLGAIPFGVLIVRSHGLDITKIGSGNIGATNVKRALGLRWAIVVFLFDLLKGFAPAFAARFVAPGQELIWFCVGITTVLGHCFSPFLRFRGGKGVATSLGMVFGASPWVATAGFAVFILCLVICRYVSLSSIIAVFCAILAGAALKDWPYLGVGSLIFLFVLYTHRKNLHRLMNGTEPKFGLGGSSDRSEMDANTSDGACEDGARTARADVRREQGKPEPRR